MAVNEVAEWQEFLDKEFPDGCVVTMVRHTEIGAAYDDSPQFLVQEFRVVDVEDGNPQVSMQLADSDRDVLMSVDKFDERPYGFAALTTEDRQPTYLLSRLLTDAQKNFVAMQKAGNDVEWE